MTERHNDMHTTSPRISKTHFTPIAAALALIFFIGAPAYADDSEWFVAGKVSLGEATMDSISQQGIGTGQLIGGRIDGALEDTEIDDYTAGIGAAVGKRIGNWTLEGELIWRYRTDFDVAASTDSIQTITNVFSNVETTSLMFNIYRRGVINQHWSWEVGAGIGLVANDIDAEYLERATATQPQMSFKDNNNETDFVYNVGAGLVRELSGPFSLNIRYRYITLGELEAGPFPNRPGVVDADHASHEIQFALEFEL